MKGIGASPGSCRSFFRRSVGAALLAGMAATFYRLLFSEIRDLSAFDGSNIASRILIYAAKAWIGLVVVVLIYKWKWSLRLLGWFFSWRILKRCLLALVALLGLAFLFRVEEDWRGKRAWENYRREWEARGEHFDFAYFIPPPVSDDHNFALSPIVASSYAEWLDGHGHRNRPAKGNVTNRLGMSIYSHGDFYVEFTNAVGNWQKAEKINLTGWQQYYRTPADTNSIHTVTTAFPATQAPQTPAADVLLALSKFDSDIEELRTASSQRPSSRFPLNYENESPTEILLPHLDSLFSCVETLQLRAAAELENGQSNKALADIALMLRLSDSIRTEPLLHSHHTRIWIVNHTIQPIWEGLTEHKWSDSQLIELEQMLGKFDFVSDHQFAMRSGRACEIATVEFMRRNRSRALNCIYSTCGVGRSGKYYPPSNSDMDESYPFITRLILHLIPSGWFYQNEVKIAEMCQQALLPSATERKEFTIADAMRDAEHMYKQERSHVSPYNALALMLQPSVLLSKQFPKVQSSLDLARVAAALERYRRAQSDYPETLNALTPRFITKLPPDIVNGRTLHYRRTADGKFLLYSIGWNEMDDGGVVGGIGKHVNIEKGDWVWRYPES